MDVGVVVDEDDDDTNDDEPDNVGGGLKNASVLSPNTGDGAVASPAFVGFGGRGGASLRCLIAIDGSGLLSNSRA